MDITVPPGECQGLHVEKFTVTGHDLKDLFYALQGRRCDPGEYTKLYDASGPKSIIWMSDTTAERRDHLMPVRMMHVLEAKRVLINGLGLGMVLQAALSYEHVEHVDVVEIDERVIKLVGPHYTKDPRVRIIHNDAYEQTKSWPKNTRWDVGWSDIWPTGDPKNSPGMTRLNRSYGQRCDWHSCWAQELMR
jgi:hypothetical protein